ncbi:hypothetical protein L1987_79136 [Smallanthus sonchifolius]|uniref:Uncharacterized protein n=1 Tax=Smallanthus sonchifolius TaxID=185202 RepID=A0ACB8ZDP2_9ASTR|nr:hypothetical protein L1987_79136 [Smallanthus sonchifolius]
MDVTFQLSSLEYKFDGFCYCVLIEDPSCLGLTIGIRAIEVNSRLSFDINDSRQSFRLRLDILLRIRDLIVNFLFTAFVGSRLNSRLGVDGETMQFTGQGSREELTLHGLALHGFEPCLRFEFTTTHRFTVLKKFTAKYKFTSARPTIGTSTKPPRLTCAEDYVDWKFRFMNHVLLFEENMWRSILKGPQIPMFDKADGTKAPKQIENYTDEDFDLVERDLKALASLTMALSPDITHNFKECTSAKQLWESLAQAFEGNDDMKASRKEMILQQFNMFNHVLGETLEAQLQRFTKLVSQMRGAQIVMSDGGSGFGDMNSGVAATTKTSATEQQAYSAQQAKLIEVNTSLCTSIMNCYAAFVSGCGGTGYFLATGYGCLQG